jgi:ADP-ribose pyrophosphatase YjhB (NUDIX family)
MDFEPQKFFIGVIDLFSVLLPGALLTFLMQSALGPLVFGDASYQALTGVAGWLAFLFASYLLGQLVFMLGAWFFDDFVYDRIRKARHNQIEHLAKGKSFKGSLLLSLNHDLIKPESDTTQALAGRIKNHYVARLGPTDTINAFQWSKAKLSLENRADALADVERFEADSKFFRSLLVVMPIFVVWKLGHWEWVPAIAVLPLGWLALRRYIELRLKAVNQSYWHVIAHEANAEKGLCAAEHRNPSHAGGVVYSRDTDGSITFLVAEARNDPSEWILPKGHIEGDERPSQTAVREVLEETGVWARVAAGLPTSIFDFAGKHIVVQNYLMEMQGKQRTDEDREPSWLPYAEAMARLSHEESRAVLRAANELVLRKPA